MVNYRLQFFSESLGCSSFYLYICTLKYNNSCILLAMKHLTIRHFGPVDECVLDMSRVNLIIGTQGSGKSCVMMIACLCNTRSRIRTERPQRKNPPDSNSKKQFQNRGPLPWERGTIATIDNPNNIRRGGRAIQTL